MPDENTRSTPTPATRGPLAAGLVYGREFGIRVLPCRAGDKPPLIKDWQNLASSDPAVILEWQQRWPDANVGLLMGDGRFALDVDPKNGGRESLARLIAEHGSFPETAEQATPSGGTHYIFTAGVEVGNSAGRLGPGLDVRGTGGFIVAAPSRTAAGVYRWVRPPWKTVFAPAPDSLISLLVRPPTRAESALVEPVVELTEELKAAIWADVERHGPSIQGRGGDAHAVLLGAKLLRDWALSLDQALVFALPWNSRNEPPFSLDDLRLKLENGGRYAKGPRGSALQRFRRPRIPLVAGRLAETATLAERALVAANVDVFSRGPCLVRPVREEVDATKGRKTTVARLRRVEAPYMRDLLSRHITWTRRDKKTEEHVTADPPMEIAQTILGREGEWLFRPVAGVISTQTLRPDGTILDAPGYDPSTRLLLISPPEMPPIPAAPTIADARRGLALLDGLLDEFPFVDAASRSVALSAILTAVARGAFSVAPMHAYSASTPGTGKSYLNDVAAAISIGQPMPVLTAARSEEETEKRLGAALIAGQPLISLDNVSNGLGGDSLCQLIERPIVEVRILGRSELVRVESRASTFGTGNNLLILGDVTRRVLLGRLEANSERPELRRFKANPVAAVLAERGRYVAAALTIVRAYVVAGRPDPAPRLASFEGWSDAVRSALIWLGCADPVATMEVARSEDPLLALHRTALETWSQRYGVGREKAKTAAEVLRDAQLDDGEFGEALRSAALNRGMPDPRTLGKWLSRHRDRIVGGLRLRGEASGKHSALWWVDGGSGVQGV